MNYLFVGHNSKNCYQLMRSLLNQRMLIPNILPKTKFKLESSPKHLSNY